MNHPDQGRQLTFAVVLLCASVHAHAMGLGQVNEPAVLGHPLDLRVPVRMEPGEQLLPECLKADVSFAERRLSPWTVSATLEPDGRAIRVRTEAPVDEPVLSVVVSAGCNPSISRSFTLFADPPAALPTSVAQVPPAPATPAVASQPEAPPRRPQPPQRPVAASGLPATPAEATTPRASGASRSAARAPQRRTPRAASAEAVRTAQAAVPAASAQRANGPRLQLDALYADATAALPGPESAASAAEAAASAAAEARARDERLQALERTLQEMRGEAARTRESLLRLQAQLARAERDPPVHPAVWVLAALCVLLAAALAWVLARQSRHGTRWLQSALAPESRRDELAEAAPASRPAVREADAPVTTPDARLALAAVSSTRRWQEAEQAAMAHQAEMVERTVVIPREALPSLPQEQGNGSHSVEELIDLEQQAEFFIVLGQEEAAIDLLRSHLSGHPDSSPLPYLKLLELHQRRGERPQYEEIRARFNERFNAYAPAWDEALSEGRSLEDYPSVIARLQALWSSPHHALEVLKASLLRTDPTSQPFDLPAYRELLLLYSIARERVEASPYQEVDILLPLGEEDEEAITGFSHSMLEPLSATTPVAPYAGPEPAVQVDLELEPALPPAGPPSSIGFEPLHLELPDEAPRRKPD